VISASSANSPQTGVLCAGALVLDTLVRPFEALKWGTTVLVDTVESRIGGSAANTARALGILEVPVRVVAFLGTDEAANAIRQEMTRCAVDISGVETASLPTPQTIVLINSAGERQFLHRSGCSDTAFSDGLRFTPELVRGIGHFHLASLFVVPHLRRKAPSMLRAAREAGLTTSLDTCWDPRGEWMNVLDPCLPELDILFMNEDEALQIAAGKSFVTMVRTILEQGTRAIVLKRGREGCSVFTSSGDITCPGYEVEVQDTTGAGDCFVAGFLAAHLEGASPERAGHTGNAAGALSVQCIGAVEGLLPRPKFDEWMARTPRRSMSPDLPAR
jgi:sugar/nucleoside kinase (ribokinase family)